MAIPLSADQLVSALKKFGVRVVEHPGWRTHNRDHKGPWGEVHGVMVHHTGPYRSEPAMVELCRTGYPSLPGPLCHGVIDRSGVVHLIGYGRTNHAGLGDPGVLAAVIAERPLPARKIANTDGNRHFYGFEAINNGTTQDWPTAQVDAMKTVSAAICDAHGWNERSVLAHKEWQLGKPDPHGIAMEPFRADVAVILHANTPAKKTKRATAAQPKVSLSRLITAAQTDPAAPQARTTYKAGVLLVEKALAAEGLLDAQWASDGHFGTKTITAYAKWQRSAAGGGYRGRDADGIPGRDSLTRLGKRHGFTITT